MLFKDLLYFFVLSLLSRKSEYPQTRSHVMTMGPEGSPSPRQVGFLWCLFPRFSPGQPPAGLPSSQKLPPRTRIKVRLSSTESEMWWEMWVEMVLHSALGPATWDITWHCSVKQNLKPQIIVWFKFPETYPTQTPVSILYPTKAYKGIFKNCLIVRKSTCPFTPPWTDSALKKCFYIKWNPQDSGATANCYARSFGVAGDSFWKALVK